VFLNLDL